MIHTDHLDPAFRFEGLARAAFNNCEKYGDPFNIAAQDIYSSFVPEPTLEGKKALSKILSKLIVDYSESQHKDPLLQLEEKIWIAKSQEQIIAIIDASIYILKHVLN